MTQPEVEKLTDVSDIATELEVGFRDAALAAVRARSAKRDQEPDAHGVYPTTECVECGEDIGPGRLAAAVRNSICVDCASERERSRRWK